MNSKSIITPLKPINKIYKDLKFSKKKYLSTKYTYDYIYAFVKFLINWICFLL